MPRGLRQLPVETSAAFELGLHERRRFCLLLAPGPFCRLDFMSLAVPRFEELTYFGILRVEPECFVEESDGVGMAGRRVSPRNQAGDALTNLADPALGVLEPRPLRQRVVEPLVQAQRVDVLRIEANGPSEEFAHIVESAAFERRRRCGTYDRPARRLSCGR